MTRAVVCSLIALGAFSAACGAGEPPRNLILISIDTLRADSLGAYGAVRDTSPHLDALAREGVLFEQVMATAPWTLPSHASLLTGRFPSHHGVTTVRHALPAGVPTLAAQLAQQGFETGAIVNVGYLGERYGLSRGFAQLEVVAPDASVSGAAAKVVERAILWLQPRRSQRCFLFVHLFDTHSDYRSRQRFEREFGASSDRIDTTSKRLSAIVEGSAEIDPREAEGLRKLYDAGVRQLDEDLAVLFDFMRTSGWLDDSLVVVTSDHGEEFLEHGSVYHGMTHYQEMLRIPLILSGPGLPKGRRISTPISLVDVAPTVLDVLGVPPLAEADGASLERLWTQSDAQSFADRALFSEAAPGVMGETRRAVRRGRYKLIFDQLQETKELYDVIDDPQESANLATAQPDRVRELTALLDDLSESARRKTEAGELSAAEWSALEALGYLRKQQPGSEKRPSR